MAFAPSLAVSTGKFGASRNTNRHLTSQELENNIGGLPITENKLKELFQKLDVNHNGYLEFDEMKAVFDSFDNFGVEYSEAEKRAKIMKYHKGTGHITYDEFCLIILSIAQR